MYSVFALATLGFVFFAFTQDVDLVRDDYYEYTLQHDQRMAARAAADALPDAAIEQGATVIHIHIPADQAPQAHGQVVLYRPNSTTNDKTMPLAVDDAGTMLIPLIDMGIGKWIVTTTWKVGEQVYEMEQPIEVQG